MANTEVAPLFARLAPDWGSVHSILVWALGDASPDLGDLASLCRRDLAVLLAWLWREPGEQEVPPLPRLCSSPSLPAKRHAQQQAQTRRWAFRLLSRWAIWQPDVVPDWAAPRLALCWRLMLRAGDRARRLAQRLHSDPDRAEVTARLVGLGHVLAECRLLPKQQLRTYFRQLARVPGWPTWLTEVLGQLDLPLPANGHIERTEFPLRIVQCAWQLAQTQLPHALRLPGPPWEELLAALGLQANDWTDTDDADATAPQGPTNSFWPLLVELVKKALHADRQEHALERQLQRWRRLAQASYTELTTALRERQLQSLAVFAAGAGHELGNPLAVISGYAEQLLRSEKHLERIQALERILAQCRRLDGLIRNLMFFARPPQPKLSRCRVQTVLVRLINQLAPYAAEKAVTLQGQVQAKLPSIIADKTMLQTAVESLLRNAIEAAPAGGWVRCSVSRDSSDELSVYVEDNGPGPDPIWQEHIFDPFFSGREAGRGRGFGLCTVWRIAQLHGGQVSWQRTAQNTTLFTLRLPIRVPRNLQGRQFHPRANPSEVA